MRSLIVCLLFSLSLAACRERTEPLSSCPEGMTQVIPNVCDDEIDTVFINVCEMDGTDLNNALWLKREWQKKFPKKQVVSISYSNSHQTMLLIQYEQRVAR